MRLLCSVAMFFALVLNLGAYEVLVIGDVHYDPRKPDGNAKLLRNGVFKRNFFCWEATIPTLLKNAGRYSEKGVDFALQLGDITQGDLSSAELQTAALSNAVERVSEHLKAPLYVVKGNHDIRGKGAREAYRDYMLPYMLKALGQDTQVPGAAHYVLKHKGDLFILFDSILPNADYVERALKSNPDARHVFFVTHIPVLPCSYGATDWLVYGRRSNNAPERERLLSLLARHNAIVLTAHIHRNVLSKYASDDGTITQITTYSMPLSTNSMELAERMEVGDELFERKNIVKLMKNEESAGVLSGFKGKMTETRTYDLQHGFSVLRVEDNGVFLDMFQCADEKPVATVRISR